MNEKLGYALAATTGIALWYAFTRYPRIMEEVSVAAACAALACVLYGMVKTL